ncbi:MAG: S9 family peptidase [Anaerolineae bacterium]|nr:S9 family peptidase [Anaerolineae bacterium]
MVTEKRGVRAEDLYALELVPNLEISPDGKYVAYTVLRVDGKKTEKKCCNLWLVATDGGEPRQFTFGDHVDTTPHWSPDSSKIAFLSNRRDEAQPQIYIISMAGGEAQPLTDMKGAFGKFAWSPDGSKILVQFRKKDKEVLEREEDENKKKLGVVFRHIDRAQYSMDGEGYYPKERWHLWIVDAESGAGQQITDSAVHDEAAPCWSPDGKQIAFISNHAPDSHLDPDADGVYIVPVESGEPRKLNAPVGPKDLASYSPDGKWIAYIGQEGRGKWWQNDSVWIVPTDGDGAARDLMAAHDLMVSAFTTNDAGSATLMPPVWSKDSHWVTAQISLHGRTTLHTVSLETGELNTLIEGDGVVGTHSMDATQKKLAYFYGSMTDPVQIWLYDMENGEKQQLTHLNQELREVWDLGELEEVWIDGPDGDDLHGWILKPPGFDPHKQYPSILEIHGGPIAQYGYFFMHEFYYLAAQGYVIHFCNPRGSLGYGEAYIKATKDGWGAEDYADVMAWTDYVAALPYIDNTRMGVTGGSYGGYMTAWIIGHTDRFKAAVAQRCVSNLVSLWGSSDGNWVFQRHFGDKAPYESIERMWACSPMAHIGSAKTPTLIIHSENDMRCPLEQGQQVYIALKKLGVNTELVLFPGEPHGLSRTGRTDRRVARLEHILEWFKRYL